MHYDLEPHQSFTDLEKSRFIKVLKPPHVNRIIKGTEDTVSLCCHRHTFGNSKRKPRCFFSCQNNNIMLPIWSGQKMLTKIFYFTPSHSLGGALQEMGKTTMERKGVLANVYHGELNSLCSSFYHPTFRNEATRTPPHP